MKVLIDGDPLCYRAALSKGVDSVADVADKVNDLISFIKENTNPFLADSDFEVYLTGVGNYRYDITETYKANRTSERPIFLEPARNYMSFMYGATTVDGEEADDAIGIRATEIGHGKVVVASIDKDMLQIPSHNYNPGKNVWFYVTPWVGIKNFYTQLLVGDTVDNVVGIWKVGPVKAGKLLADCSTEQELFDACLEAYGGDTDRMMMNGQLLWLRRYEGQIWNGPGNVSKDGNDTVLP